MIALTMMSVGLTVHAFGCHDRLLDDVDAFVAVLHREPLPAVGVVVFRPRPP